jgi:hypothetical protein
MGELRVCRFNSTGLAHLYAAATFFEVQANWCRLLHYGVRTMIKPIPNPPRSTIRNGQLFTVSPDIHTESLLANASEDLLSISAIAADLADHVEGRSRSVSLAISRMADGVHLLVERALDHIDLPTPPQQPATT